MRDPSRRVAVLAAVAAVVVAVLAVVTNVATAQVPHALRFLTSPSRAWMLVGALIVVSAVLAFVAAHSGDRPRQVSAPEEVGAAADLLAQRMTAFWADQVVKRGIQTPAPVRVRWEWAGDDVALDRREVNAPAPLGTDPPPLPGGAPGEAPGEVLSSGALLGALACTVGLARGFARGWISRRTPGRPHERPPGRTPDGGAPGLVAAEPARCVGDPSAGRRRPTSTAAACTPMCWPMPDPMHGAVPGPCAAVPVRTGQQASSGRLLAV